MRCKAVKFIFLFFAFLVLTAFASVSAAKTIYVPDDYAKIQWAVDNATAEVMEITSCITITSPGYYILTDDIVNSSEFHCIQIQSSDVILDGRGHVVDGINRLGSYGIDVYGPYTNVTIKILQLLGGMWEYVFGELKIVTYSIILFH